MSPRTSALLIVALTFLSPLRSQQTALEREAAFVRNLATKLRFISLAQSEVDRMKQRYKDAADFQRVAQLGIEISLIGAKAHPNRAEKRTLYHDALGRCQQFLERYSDGPAALAARMTLADASLEFGKFLADEIEVARLDAPSTVKVLEEQAAEVFRAGVDASERAMVQIEPKRDSDPRSNTDYGVTWMHKGILLREHARAVKKDREYLAQRSQDTLEELIFEYGEETALGQRALFEYAKNNEVLGDLDEAVMSYGDVIESADTALTNDEFELPPDIRELMVITLEEAYDRVASTQFTQGKIQAVIATTKKYREHLTALHVPLTDLDDPATTKGKEDTKFGHSLYLTYARAMAESGVAGDSSKALALVQFLNEEHPNDFVGLRAKAALKEVLAAKASGVSGLLLLEVAKGDFQAKEWEPAVQSFRRAISAMNDAELSSHGLEAYYRMGRSLERQGRVLAATLAVAHGLDRYGSNAEDKGLPERASNLMQVSLRRLRANSLNDPYYDSLANRVADLAATHGSVADAAKRAWVDGGNHLARKQYDDAVRSYRRIPTDSIYYEWAQARIVSALERNLDFAAARETIANYRAFLATKESKIPRNRDDLKQARQLAQAEIDFHEAYMLYREGLGKDKSGTPDLTKFPEVIKLLGDYETRHGKAGAQLTPRTYFVLGKSYIEMGKLDKAEEKYRTLNENSPRNANIPILASSIFTAYDNEITAKAQEVDAIASSGDDAALKQALTELDGLRRKAVTIGLDYANTSDKPQYQICSLTLKNLQALQDWPSVESFGNKLVKEFSSNPQHSGKVDKHARPIIGDAILRQHKYRQAYDMLVAAEKADPKDYPLKRLICLALGGWQEVNARGGIDSYEGMGKPAEAYQKFWTEYKTYGLNRNRGIERYTLPWYAYHWEVYHFALQAAKTDSKFAERARTLFNLAKSTDDFAHLASLGAKGKELRSLFDANQPPR